MALLSEPRFGVGDPQVAVANITAPADQSTAKAIQAFGDIGGQIRQGMMKGQLRNELQESANIISSINAGYPQLQEDIQSGRIDDQSEKFYRLSLAAEQGKISKQRAQLEAEVLLRSSIAQAPGFADEFRKTARDALGFDPTGAALNSLFLSGPDADSTRLTQEQKDIEQAQAMVAGGAVTSVQEGVRLINEARVSELRQTTMSSAIRDGRINAGRVAVEAANRVSDAASPILLQAMQQIRQFGGIEDIESLKNSVLANTQLQVRKLENEMAESTEYVYEPDAYNTMRSRAEEVGASIVTILENQDMLKILSRRSDILDTTANIGLFQIAPELAIISGLGDAAITSYLDLITLAQNDPRRREELIKRNPNFAWIAEVDSLVSKDIAASIKARAEGTLGARVQTGEIGEQEAKAVVRESAERAKTGQTTAEEFEQTFQAAMQMEMPKTAFSMVAKNPASYSNLSADSRKIAVQNIRQEQQRQVNSISNALSQSGYQLSYKDGKFRVIDPQDRALSELDPLSDVGGSFSTLPGMPGRDKFVSDRLANQAGVKDQVNFLNSQLLPIMQNVRWANEAGFGNTDQWAQQVSATVNSNSGFRVDRAGTGAAVPAYQGNPLVEGLTREEQIVAQFEGLHDPEASSWDGKTVAYGLDLDTNPRAKEYIDEFGLKGKSRDEIAAFFRDNPEASASVLTREVTKHKQELATKWKPMRNLDEVRQEAMANLAYNIGPSKVLAFNNMLKGLESGDYETAGLNLVFNFKDNGTIAPTKYLKDVGTRRAATLMLALTDGRWPDESEVAEAERRLAPYLED